VTVSLKTLRGGGDAGARCATVADRREQLRGRQAGLPTKTIFAKPRARPSMSQARAKDPEAHSRRRWAAGKKAEKVFDEALDLCDHRTKFAGTGVRAHARSPPRLRAYEGEGMGKETPAKRCGFLLISSGHSHGRFVPGIRRGAARSHPHWLTHSALRSGLEKGEREVDEYLKKQEARIAAAN